MKIHDLIDKTKEYHSQFPPHTAVMRRYYSKQGDYKCAIGCLLNDSRKLQNFCGEADVYLLKNLFMQNNRHKLKGFLKENSEPLLEELLSPDNTLLLRSLIQVQHIHDSSITIGEYLKCLMIFKEELNEAPDK
jgi:hypothetical protein